DVNNYIYADKNNIRKWDKIKLANIPEIDKALNDEYGKFKYGAISSDHLLKIIEVKSVDNSILKKCDQLRKVEVCNRNIAAHEIVSVNSKWIEKSSGLKPEKIVKLIESILNYSSIKTKEDFFSSYDRMNDFLINCMNEV
ncbi:MAG: hypothetical protein ACI4VF_03880, partial [Lachnospirales bacterium]